MDGYLVKINFDDGTNDYDLPHVQSVSDPQEGMKATVIKGTRGDGCIVIPGGKKSIEITVKGKIFEDDYKLMTAAMTTLRSKVTTAVATLTLEHYDDAISAPGWQVDWAYTVRRIEDIRFPESMRIGVQEYEVTFIVLVY
jgi:hypothetical protein